MICLSKSYWNVYRKSSAKRECHDGNVFLKADRALSELNFLFHLNSKTNFFENRKRNTTQTLFLLLSRMFWHVKWIATTIFSDFKRHFRYEARWKLKFYSGKLRCPVRLLLTKFHSKVYIRKKSHPKKL